MCDGMCACVHVRSDVCSIWGCVWFCSRLCCFISLSFSCLSGCHLCWRERSSAIRWEREVHSEYPFIVLPASLFLSIPPSLPHSYTSRVFICDLLNLFMQMHSSREKSPDTYRSMAAVLAHVWQHLSESCGLFTSPMWKLIVAHVVSRHVFLKNNIFTCTGLLLNVPWILQF